MLHKAKFIIIVVTVFCLCAFIHCQKDNSEANLTEIWDRDTETPLQFQGRICGQWCNGTQLIDERPFWCAECFPCSCDASCQTEGTCCPQLGAEWAPHPAERSQCIDGMLHVTSCSPDFPAGPTRRLCETRPSTRTRDTMMPVTSLNSEVTYANRYCAACNYDDEDLIDWIMVPYCRHNQFLYDVTTDREYEDRALALPDVCHITWTHNTTLWPHECLNWFYEPQSVTSSCNVTGQWQTEDAELRALCERPSSLAERVFYSQYPYSGSFSNIFCVLCNVDYRNFLDGSDCYAPSSNTHNNIVPIRGIFTLMDTQLQLSGAGHKSNCSAGQWIHPTGECRALQCTAGKVLKNGQCVTPVDYVQGLGYHVKLLLRVTGIRNTDRATGSSKHSPWTSVTDQTSTTDTGTFSTTSRSGFTSTDGAGFSSLTTSTTAFTGTAETSSTGTSSTTSFQETSSKGFTSTTSRTGVSGTSTAGSTPAGWTETAIASTIPPPSSAGETTPYGFSPHSTTRYSFSSPTFSSVDVATQFVYMSDSSRDPCSYTQTLASLLKKSPLDAVYDASVNVTTVLPQSEFCVVELLETKIDELVRTGRTPESGKAEEATDLNSKAQEIELDSQEIKLEAEVAQDASFLNVILEADVISDQYTPRDRVEQGLTWLYSVWEVQIGRWTVQLSPTDLNAGFYQDVNLVNEVQTGDLKEDQPEVEVQISHLPYQSPYPSPLMDLKSTFLPAGRRLVCPYAQFQPDEYQILHNGHKRLVQFPHYVHSDYTPVQLDVEVETKAWLTDDGRLSMCQDLVLSLFPDDVIVVPKEASATTLVLMVVTGVCGSVSIICLILTFVTYCLFSELRSLPGLNNMGLALTLALAQLTLLLPWHTTRSEVTCRAVGVVTHWTWLAALCWMGVCCVHMVRVFTASSRRSHSGSELRRSFLKGVLATLLVPTIIVSLTLGVTASQSNGRHLGYGGNVCFLESSLHVGLAFLLPLALLVTLNLTCFIFTVVAIMRVRRLQAHNPRERSDVLVYAKLATVTGGSWVLSLLGEALEQDWLLVLGELCTASQGLLLFLAYVCNKRVLNLYRKRLGYAAKDADSTTLTLTKMTTVETRAHNVEASPEKSAEQNV